MGPNFFLLLLKCAHINFKLQNPILVLLSFEYEISLTTSTYLWTLDINGGLMFLFSCCIILLYSTWQLRYSLNDVKQRSSLRRSETSFFLGLEMFASCFSWLNSFFPLVFIERCSPGWLQVFSYCTYKWEICILINKYTFLIYKRVYILPQPVLTMSVNVLFLLLYLKMKKWFSNTTLAF